MSEGPAKKADEVPRGFLWSVGVRLLFTFILVPLLLTALYFMAPHARSVPAYAALAAVVLTFIWWKDTNPDPKERHAIRFLVAGAYGAGNLVMGLASAGWSLLHASGLGAWVTDNLASGQLSFFVSATLFGLTLLMAGYNRRVSTAAIWQNCIFALALLNLGYGYSLDEPIPRLELLSWSIFFIIGDWALIEQYVIDRKQALAMSDYLRIIIVNAVVLYAWVILMINLWPPVHPLWYWFGVVNLMVVALILWCGSAASLADFTQVENGKAVKPTERIESQTSESPSP